MFVGIETLIKRISNKYKIHPSIIYGIILEYGKSSLNPITYLEYINNDFRVGVARVPFSKINTYYPDIIYLFNPENNIEACFNIVERYSLQYGNLRKAIFMYNCSDEANIELYKYDQFTTNVFRNSNFWKLK